MKKKKQIYILIIFLALVMLIIGIILNFKSKTPKLIDNNTPELEAKYSIDDAKLELNKLYKIDTGLLEYIGEEDSFYIFEISCDKKTVRYKFDKNTGIINTSTIFG